MSTNEPDWATQLVDTFETAVDAVRSKTSEPATKFVKYAVFAVMASSVLLLLGAFLIIGLIRLLTNYLPWGGVWLSYFILGGLFLLAGAFLWRKRKPVAAA